MKEPLEFLLLGKAYALADNHISAISCYDRALQSCLSSTLFNKPTGKVARLENNLGSSPDGNVMLSLEKLRARLYLEKAISYLVQEDKTSCEQSFRSAFYLNPSEEMRKVLLDYFRREKKREDFQDLKDRVVEKENVEQWKDKRLCLKFFTSTQTLWIIGKTVF